mgnify:CR=1 FL=1
MNANYNEEKIKPLIEQKKILNDLKVAQNKSGQN